MKFNEIAANKMTLSKSWGRRFTAAELLNIVQKTFESVEKHLKTKCVIEVGPRSQYERLTDISDLDVDIVKSRPDFYAEISPADSGDSKLKNAYISLMSYNKKSKVNLVLTDFAEDQSIEGWDYEATATAVFRDLKAEL